MSQGAEQTDETRELLPGAAGPQGPAAARFTGRHALAALAAVAALTLALLTVCAGGGPQRSLGGASEAPLPRIFRDSTAKAVTVPEHHGYQLQSVLDITAVNPGFETLSLKRCALVGSGDILTGARKGHDIDSHSVVIRINRLPSTGFFEDFGNRTDILVLFNYFHNNSVQTMGKHSTKNPGIPIDCAEPGSGCYHTGMVYTGVDGCAGAYRPWPPQHYFIGCVHKNMTQFIEHQVSREPSSGFRAFLVFASVCERLDVYGFGGKTKERGTADGHVESSIHSLEEEHSIESAIASGSWDHIKGPHHGFQAAAGEVDMIDVRY